jgi:hypothetical protein
VNFFLKQTIVIPVGMLYIPLDNRVAVQGGQCPPQERVKKRKRTAGIARPTKRFLKKWEVYMNRKISLFSGVIVLLLTMPAYGGWNTSLSKDEMTGKKSAYASSPITAPSKRMEFPYGDTKAWVGVGCDGTTEWAYVGFNTPPNLSNTDTKDGYNLISTRIKWGEKVENITLTQEWSAKFIHFRDDKSIISNIAKSNSVLLELNWHGHGNIYFKFSLSGSSAALKKIRNECAK